MENVSLLNFTSMSTFFSEDERPSKSGESKDRRKHEHTSMENETTSTNINSYNKESTASRTKPKGKRLKIVEVDSENDSETTQHLNDNICADKGDEVKQRIDITHQKDSNDATAAMNGVNSHPCLLYTSPSPRDS